MGHNISTGKRRIALLRLPLADLDGWHMLLTCPACRDERTIDMGMLLKLIGVSACWRSSILACFVGSRLIDRRQA